MVCRCRKAERTGALASRYFGYQATLHRSVYRALLGCFEAGTVRNMALRCQTSIHSRTLFRDPFLGARALFCPELTVRLHARSHARGQHLGIWTLIIHSTAIGDSPVCPLSSHKRESDIEHTLLLVASPTISTLILDEVWLRHSLQVFAVYSSIRTWAQCISHPSLHHQDPDLGRPATHFWSTSHHLVVYFPDARPLIHPQVLSLPIVIAWKVRRLDQDMTVSF
jgi:hypothetical protein